MINTGIILPGKTVTTAWINNNHKASPTEIQKENASLQEFTVADHSLHPPQNPNPKTYQETILNNHQFYHHQ